MNASAMIALPLFFITIVYAVRTDRQNTSATQDAHLAAIQAQSAAVQAQSAAAKAQSTADKSLAAALVADNALSVENLLQLYQICQSKPNVGGMKLVETPIFKIIALRVSYRRFSKPRIVRVCSMLYFQSLRPCRRSAQHHLVPLTRRMGSSRRFT